MSGNLEYILERAIGPVGQIVFAATLRAAQKHPVRRAIAYMRATRFMVAEFNPHGLNDRNWPISAPGGGR
jgi:hypothetical protein